MIWFILACNVTCLSQTLAEPLSTEQATARAEILLAAIPTIQGKENPFPFTIDPNAAQARGWERSEGRVAALLVPDRGLSADPNHPALDQEKGLPVGWLFFRGFEPTSIDSARVPRLSLSQEEPAGPWNALQLSARQTAPGSYHIEFWPNKDKPLFASELITTRRSPAGVVDVREDTGVLSLYAHGQYASFVPIVEKVLPTTKP
jgi:hypothetical protein